MEIRYQFADYRRLFDRLERCIPRTRIGSFNCQFPRPGFGKRGDGRLMFERGEANIDYQTSSSYLKGGTPLVEAGTATPWFSFGRV